MSLSVTRRLPDSFRTLISSAYGGRASESEQQALIDELLDRVAVHPDHLEVAISGAPRINVLLVKWD